jgi:hypothetical protein
MINSSRAPSVVLCLLLLLEWVMASKKQLDTNWLQKLPRQFASAQRKLQERRNLQKFPFIAIDYTPGADPEMVCNEFTDAVNSTLQCSCNIAPDKSVALKCLEIDQTCNQGGSVCYLQTLNIALTPTDNKIKSIESCTNYVADLTNFSKSTTQFANYSSLVPCVKVIPPAPDDFSSVASCTATMNGAACYKCEPCSAHSPSPGISMDCCNTSPDGEQLKVECGIVGGGAFVPFFETYEEGKMGTCASGAKGGRLDGRMYELLVAASMIVAVSSWLVV